MLHWREALAGASVHAESANCKRLLALTAVEAAASRCWLASVLHGLPACCACCWAAVHGGWRHRQQQHHGQRHAQARPAVSGRPGEHSAPIQPQSAACGLAAAPQKRRAVLVTRRRSCCFAARCGSHGCRRRVLRCDSTKAIDQCGAGRCWQGLRAWPCSSQAPPAANLRLAKKHSWGLLRQG